MCYIQRSKYVKYNGPHQTIHHCQFVWYCKANDKINPLRLKTKKGEFCPHSFRCLNCKGEHQVNIKQILLTIHSGNTDLIKNGILKNILNFGRTGKYWLIQLWTIMQYDFKGLKDFFTERPKKQLYHQYHSWSQSRFRHNFYLRTILDNN